MSRFAKILAAGILLAVGGGPVAAVRQTPQEPPKAPAPTPPPPVEKGPASDELKRLRDEDQADRQRDWSKVSPAELEAIAERDRKRLARVRELLEQDKVVTPEDFDHAALIFQHGVTPDDYLVAHELALVALLTSRSRGFNNLPVLAEDRFLLSVGRKQRFGAQGEAKPTPDGSQIQTTDEEGDLAVTDTLRADLFMAPLAVAKKEGPMGTMKVFDSLAAHLKQRMDPTWQEAQKDRPAAKRLAEAAAQAGDPATSRAEAGKLAAEVLKLYQADELKTPADYRNAARALLATAGQQEDGERTARQLLLAHELAMVAALRGAQEARPILATSWDAFLKRIGQPQRYGTLFGNGGDATPLPPVARSASDTVRKVFGVPPLKRGAVD